MPASDAGFREWLENFIDYAGPHATELGLTTGNIAEMQADRVAFVTAYTTSMAAEAAAGNAVVDKNIKRAEAEKTMRKYVNILQVSPQVSDPERESLRIPIRDKQPTPTDPEAIKRVIPPKLHLDTSQPGLIRVHFGMEPTNERRNAKPKGVHGARILVLPGLVPSGTQNLASLPWVWAADDTESPYTYTATGGGIFTFRVQWFDQLMNLGPLCDPMTGAATE
jgi:hypothetical protein